MLKYAPQLSLSADRGRRLRDREESLGVQGEAPQGLREASPGRKASGTTPRASTPPGSGNSRPGARPNVTPTSSASSPGRLGRRSATSPCFQAFRAHRGAKRGPPREGTPLAPIPWRVLRVGLFLPLLGREVPRDLSPLKPVLKAFPRRESGFGGPWEGWRVGRGPHPGRGPECANVHFG